MGDAAVTDLVFHLDVDFVPSPCLHERIASMSRLSANLSCKTAWVIPAAELSQGMGEVSGALDFHSGPACADAALRRCLSQGQVMPFHVSHYAKGHGPTQLYTKWLQSDKTYEAV